MLSDHFISGVGQGRFGVELGLAQISYFSNGDYSIRELLLADNVVHAYNDYLEFLVEHGIASMVVVLAGFRFLFLIIGKIRFAKKQLSIFALLCLLQIFAMLVAACFTFVFYRFFFQVLFIFCLLALTCYAGIGRRYLLVVSVVILSGLVFCNWEKINNIRFSEELDQIRMYSKSGYSEEALEICEILHPCLESDEEFLWLYVNCLLDVGDGANAIKYASRLVELRNNNLVYGLLAKAYLLKGDFSAAELHYTNAVNKVPNRFHSRYELFDFYLKRGKVEKAKTVKNQILLLPVKIPSVHVDRIKQSVQSVNL